MTVAGGLFTTTAMADLFSPHAHVSQMIRSEAALARSAARAGVITGSDGLVDRRYAGDSARAHAR